MAAAALVGAVTALLQTAVVPQLVDDPLAAPVLPVVMVAAWGTRRRASEVSIAVIMMGVCLGLLSTARAGWFVLALLPALGLALAAESGEPERASLLRRAVLAGLIGGVGAAAYLSVLPLAGGHAEALSEARAAVLLGATWTALLGSGLALVLAPFGRQRDGLFA